MIGIIIVVIMIKIIIIYYQQQQQRTAPPGQWTPLRAPSSFSSFSFFTQDWHGIIIIVIGIIITLLQHRAARPVDATARAAIVIIILILSLSSSLV